MIELSTSGVEPVSGYTRCGLAVSAGTRPADEHRSVSADTVAAVRPSTAFCEAESHALNVVTGSSPGFPTP